jgi:hemerythrin-like metal-binding protein
MAMEWIERYVLGIARMDEMHREFVEFCNAFAADGPESQNFLERFDAFIEHTTAHFDQENRWMEAVNFPPCHRKEHDRVLAVASDVRQRVEKGDLLLGRRLFEELPAWFDEHIGTMDTVLAFYLKRVGFDTETGTLPEGKIAASLPSVHDVCGRAAPQTDKTS